jgi:hypothetical protein
MAKKDDAAYERALREQYAAKASTQALVALCGFLEMELRFLAYSIHAQLGERIEDIRLSYTLGSERIEVGPNFGMSVTEAVSRGAVELAVTGAAAPVERA